MAARLNGLLLTLGLVLPLTATALQDPTAPPGMPDAAGAAASPTIPLTAIKTIGNQRMAIIGGQEVPVGGRYQEARVVRITDTEVVLRQGGETTVLKLYPQVEKRLRGQ